MSDCRFGVSPVNYPDPDPELSFILNYTDRIFVRDFPDSRLMKKKTPSYLRRIFGISSS